MRAVGVPLPEFSSVPRAEWQGQKEDPEFDAYVQELSVIPTGGRRLRYVPDPGLGFAMGAERRRAREGAVGDEPITVREFRV